MINRKKKICCECNKECLIFSKGRCKECATLEYNNTTKINRRAKQDRAHTKSKKKPVSKKPTVSSLKKKLWQIFSQYIRIKYSDSQTGIGECFTCGEKLHWKKLQCGHGISRRFNSTLFHEQNNHPQCSKCNILLSGEQYIYSKKVDEKYGPGTFDKLYSLSQETKHFTTFELEQLMEEYKTKLNELKKEKNL